MDKAADMLSAQLRHSFGNRVLGPEEPTVSRIQNLYLKNILIKIERDKSFAKAKSIIRELKGRLTQVQNFSTVHVVADVEPY